MARSCCGDGRPLVRRFARLLRRWRWRWRRWRWRRRRRRPVESLTVAEVEQILAQAIAEALARGVTGTIAVVDRVGNVLAVFRMTGAATTVTITSGRGVTGGLEGRQHRTGHPGCDRQGGHRRLSLTSRGNAFTTRTRQSDRAGALQSRRGSFAPGGPLFGVQFSQLPCSDLNTRFISGSPAESIGPKRSPLGFSADAGGLPLYKNGDPVGGIGVITDGIYGLDLDRQQHRHRRRRTGRCRPARRVSPRRAASGPTASPWRANRLRFHRSGCWQPGSLIRRRRRPSWTA